MLTFGSASSIPATPPWLPTPPRRHLQSTLPVRAPSRAAAFLSLLVSLPRPLRPPSRRERIPVPWVPLAVMVAAAAVVVAVAVVARVQVRARARAQLRVPRRRCLCAQALQEQRRCLVLVLLPGICNEDRRSESLNGGKKPNCGCYEPFLLGVDMFPTLINRDIAIG